MSNRTQPPSWPSPRGPWPEVEDVTRLFDQGKPWCATAVGHPGPDDDYPDVDRHVPWDECRTVTSYFDSARRDLTGTAVGLEAYAASPYQFGALRETAQPTEPRIVLESYIDSPGEEPVRVSLALGDALLLSRRIGQLVDLVSNPAATVGL
jgi:hypothetical protein